MNLKEARKAERYSMKQVSEVMGISLPTYAKWENNPETITIANAKKLARLFRVSVSDLFFGGEL